MDNKLHKFSRLAEIGNYTQTAKQLHISQPALTVAVQKLEQELGTQLFVRSGRRVALTPAGHAVYQATLEHQDITSNLRNTLRRIASKRPAISVGMIDSIAEQLCITPSFEALELAADITVVVNNSRYLREALERRKLDCAFLIADEREHQGLTTTIIGSEQLELVVSPTIEASITASLTTGQLNQFISYDRSSTTYAHITHHFVNKGIRTHTSLYSTSPSLMLSMVLNGKGCAVLPSHMVAPYITTGRLKKLLSPMKRPVVCMSVARKPVQGPMRAFIEETMTLL